MFLVNFVNFSNVTLIKIYSKFQSSEIGKQKRRESWLIECIDTRVEWQDSKSGLPLHPCMALHRHWIGGGFAMHVLQYVMLPCHATKVWHGLQYSLVVGIAAKQRTTYRYSGRYMPRVSDSLERALLLSLCWFCTNIVSTSFVPKLVLFF